MTNDIPVSTISEQSLTRQAFTPDSTLVDDTVALVDDTAALVGGPQTIVENIQFKIDNNAPNSIIEIYR